VHFYRIIKVVYVNGSAMLVNASAVSNIPCSSIHYSSIYYSSIYYSSIHYPTSNIYHVASVGWLSGHLEIPRNSLVPFNRFKIRLVKFYWSYPWNSGLYCTIFSPREERRPVLGRLFKIFNIPRCGYDSS
jgi:hypothetical protein